MAMINLTDFEKDSERVSAHIFSWRTHLIFERTLYLSVRPTNGLLRECVRMNETTDSTHTHTDTPRIASVDC